VDTRFPLKYWIHFLNIFPCKVLEVKKVTDSKSVYKIFSKDVILKTYYSDRDLVCFPGLNSIDPFA
jgi:hypothetical protein